MYDLPYQLRFEQKLVSFFFVGIQTEMDDLKSSAEVGYQLVKKKLITILNDMVSRTFNGAKLTFFFLELLLKFELCFHQKAKMLQQNRYQKKNSLRFSKNYLNTIRRYHPSPIVLRSNYQTFFSFIHFYIKTSERKRGFVEKVDSSLHTQKKKKE